MKTKQKSPQELLDLTKRTQYVDKSVLETFPEKQEGTLEFFKLDRYISNNHLEKEYVSRGLVAADPSTLLDYDLSNRADMDEKRWVCTHWKDANGTWCYIAFYRWSGDGRGVLVDRDGVEWIGFWWFAGLRKSSEIGASALLDAEPSELPLQKHIDIVKADRISG
jgi:hypothetical protein